MSNQAIQAVRQCSKLKARLRDLLEAVAAFVEDGLTADPSVGDLAGYLGVTDRTARRLIQQAEAAGELKVERNAGRETPRGRTNRYTLTLAGVTFVSGVTQISPVCMYVDSPLLENQEETYIQTGDTNVTPEANVTPTEDRPAPPVNAVTVIKDLAEYGISGPHIWASVKTALARSGGVDEIYDVLDYFDALKAKPTKKPLGAAWVAKQLAEIAASQEPRSWRWCDQLEPAPVDEFERIRADYGGYLQPSEGHHVTATG